MYNLKSCESEHFRNAENSKALSLILAFLGSERSNFLNYTANYSKHPLIRKTEIPFMTHNDMIGDDDV